MTIIGSSQLSQSQLDAARNSAAAQAAPLQDVDKTRPADAKANALHPPGGLSIAVGAGSLAISPASLEGVNWDALAADMSTTDTMSISISDIMVLLVTTMSEMRKGQREAWMADAQNALAMGLNAADRMRESAAAKLACDVISNGTAIITAGVQIGMQGASLVKELAVSKAVNAQVDAAMQAQQRAVEAAQTQATQAVTKQLTQETSELGAEATQALKWNDNPIFEAPGKSAGMGEAALSQNGAKLGEVSAETFDHLEPKSVGAGPANQSLQQQGNGPKSFDAKQSQLETKQMEIKMWATQEKANLMKPFNTKIELLSKGLDIAGALGKTGASVGEYFSGIKQAEAQEARARGDFASNVAQVELDFANELRDTMKAALDTMKSVEASRHQAMQGIYNI